MTPASTSASPRRTSVRSPSSPPSEAACRRSDEWCFVICGEGPCLVLLSHPGPEGAHLEFELPVEVLDAKVEHRFPSAPSPSEILWQDDLALRV